MQRGLILQTDYNSIPTVEYWEITHTFIKNWMQVFKDTGLKGAEMQTLMIIAYFGGIYNINTEPVPVGALAAKLELSNPATSQKISALEEHGYIERTFSKNDKRAVCVCLTKKGKQKVLQIRNKFTTILQKATLKYGKEKSRQLFNSMHEFCNVLNDIKNEEDI